MSLIVEDGTVVAGAESYLSLADANSHHSDRDNSLWTGTDAVKEAALRKATDYLRQYYRQRWKGIPVSSVQTLDWPRSGVIVEDLADALGEELGSNVVPQEVKTTTAELAVRALGGSLAPDLPRGGRIKSEKVDVIAVSYEDGAPTGPRYPAVERTLAPLLKPDRPNLVRG